MIPIIALSILSLVAVCLVITIFYTMAMIPLEMTKNEIEYGQCLKSQTQLFRPVLKQNRLLKILARLKLLENLAFLILHNSEEGRLRYYRFFPQQISFREAICSIQMQNTEDQIELMLQTRTTISVITINISDFEEYRNFEAKPVMSETAQTCESEINLDDSSQNDIACQAISYTH